MTAEEFYGPAFKRLELAKKQVLDTISNYETDTTNEMKIIQYCISRIKSPLSMINKLKKIGVPVNYQSALTEVHDAVGIRIICSFIDDIYKIASWLEEREEFTILKTKDYIAYPKENGYRSYHMILRIEEGAGAGVEVEVQIRTIALDFWANLEHQLKYKKEIKNEELIRGELKRCADEIASIDFSMQTIKDLIFDECLEEEIR